MRRARRAGPAGESGGGEQRQPLGGTGLADVGGAEPGHERPLAGGRGETLDHDSDKQDDDHGDQTPADDPRAALPRRDVFRLLGLRFFDLRRVGILIHWLSILAASAERSLRTSAPAWRLGRAPCKLVPHHEFEADQKRAPRTYGQSGRQRRREAEEAARKQRTRTIAFIAVLAVLVLGAIAGAIALSGGTKSNQASIGGTTVPATTPGTPTTAVAENPGPETAPIPGGTELAPASTTAAGTTVDGIQCQANEQAAYHIHAHLDIFVAGQQVQIPAGIGIPNAKDSSTSGDAFVNGTVCLYWLHTHAADGIIHVEAPGSKLYTLGNFFDEWQQPLGPNQVGPDKGVVTAFVDGKPFTGDPGTIVLNKHTVIQLDVGEPIVPAQPFNQWGQL